MLCTALRLLSAMVPVLLLVSANQDLMQVIGLVNRSVELSANLPLPLSVEETIWKFRSGSRTVKVAEVQNISLLTYSDQFTKRIRAFNNGTTIIIRNLSLKDSGKYYAEIILTNREISRSTFNLIVYEPVPSPAIQTEWEANTTERCNLTLHCSAPSHTSDLSYTWKYKHQDSEYQQYKTGSTIHISLPPRHHDMEYLCIVQNPADQKNVSLHTAQLCPETDNAEIAIRQKRGNSRHFYIHLSIYLSIYLS
ncbi:SLAM family member, partial [Pristimantis euphronides]